MTVVVELTPPFSCTSLPSFWVTFAHHHINYADVVTPHDCGGATACEALVLHAVGRGDLTHMRGVRSGACSRSGVPMPLACATPDLNDVSYSCPYASEITMIRCLIPSQLLITT